MEGMELSKQWVVSVIFFSSLICFATPETTPVFLWTNQGKLPDVATPVGQHLTSSKFNKQVISHLANKAKGNIVAFLHDKLSLDDITKHADVYNENSNGNIFKNLKNAIEEHTSLEIPSVHDAASSVQELVNNFKGKVHYLNEPHELKSLPLDDKHRHIIMVHMPSDSQDHKESLRKNDKIVGKITDELKKWGKPFTALYTGQEPSRVPSETLYMGRHLLATTSKRYGVPTRFFNFSDCAYLYITNLNVTLTQITKNNEETKRQVLYSRSLVSDDVTLNYNTVQCKNGTTKLAFTATDQKQEITNFRLEMNVNTYKPFDWGIESMKLMVTIAKPVSFDTTADMNPAGLMAAKGFSYHCSDPPIINPANATDSGSIVKIISLKFEGLQFQVTPTPIKGQKFAPPDDCVGFFTIGIWSGIIMGIVFTLVLAFGIMMIMNISTMDRFDDPKGKQLIINVAE